MATVPLAAASRPFGSNLRAVAVRNLERFPDGAKGATRHEVTRCWQRSIGAVLSGPGAVEPDGARNLSDFPVRGVFRKTLQQIAERVLAGTGGDVSLVCLRLGDGTYRIEAYAGDFPAEVIPALDFRAGDAGTGGVVAETGRPRLIRDYPVELADSPFIETGKRVGVRSIVNAACGPAGDVVAVLYVMSRTPNVFTERDMEVLAAQARIADIAIRNAMRQSA